MKSKFPLKALLSQFQLVNIGVSLFLTVLIYLLISPKGTPFIVKEKFEESTRYLNDMVSFEDLDGDGVDEKLLTFHEQSAGYLVFQVYLSSGGFLDQWNHLSDEEKRLYVSFGDYNKDGLKEAYLIGRKEDDIYLHRVDPFGAPEKVFEPVFIDRIQYSEGEASFMVTDFLFQDVNGDGFDEAIFGLYGTYKTFYPRRLYAVDINSGSICAVSDTLGTVLAPIFFTDLDGDGTKEITGSSSSSVNNSFGSLPKYHDHSSWYMVFNPDLSFQVEPLEIPPAYSRLFFTHQDYGTDESLQGLIFHKGKDVLAPQLVESQVYGELNITYEFPDDINYQVMSIAQLKLGGTYRTLVQSSKEGLFVFDREQNLKRHVRYPFESRLAKESLPFSNDELLVIRNMNEAEYLFVDARGRTLAKYSNDKYTGQLGSLGWTNYFDDGAYYIKTDQRLVYFQLLRNYLYHFRILFFVLIFVGMCGLLYLIRWNQLRQLQRVSQMEDKMLQLELQGLKNQLDPHFTFNALNVLSFLSSHKDHSGVESFTDHFSRLLRRQLEMSDKPSVSLHDELSFIRHYIALQKLRFESSINYDEEIRGEVDMNLRIPKMMIHTHVENAIKHGLLPSGRGGIVRVIVRADKNSTQITIQDNGIGRSPLIEKTSDSAHNNTGKGLVVLNQLYDLFYQLYKIKIRQDIVDLKDDEGKPVGTKITIFVPL
ncbi:MAG: histidine kinase [Bacteroidetes bacterium]|jgi:hypothetical protein|nr:histidine kinase [Bacteroidota bacterium]MBT3748008.1 histidine kinase [Bacteroidota bacterium]MBT4400001.1 histidine kinase [Bacteroidota bacterium]MBT4409683.1 histidine kinase [Bacteroidota bacterium]MBT5428038.1 histidine kinase [Bacteroidota bacterium]